MHAYTLVYPKTLVCQQIVFSETQQAVFLCPFDIQHHDFGMKCIAVLNIRPAEM